MQPTDTYKTIASPPPEVLFKDRNSKFYGYAFPVTTEDEIKSHLTTLKKKHHQAGHFCYAWQLGLNYERHRTNDDGEPNNSAGKPIYGQIQSFNLTQILIVIVRYFGGTKLGVSGLINAYRTSAKETIIASEILEKTIDVHLIIIFDYPLLSKVMRIIKENNLKLLHQKQELQCEFKICIRKKDSNRIKQLFEETQGILIKV